MRAEALRAVAARSRATEYASRRDRRRSIERSSRFCESASMKNIFQNIFKKS